MSRTDAKWRQVIDGDSLHHVLMLADKAIARITFAGGSEPWRLVLATHLPSVYRREIPCSTIGQCQQAGLLWSANSDVDIFEQLAAVAHLGDPERVSTKEELAGWAAALERVTR